MKVIAYMPLHYGAEYLKESIQSVAPFVDKIMIFYTNKPSYGFGTNIPCPESEQMLKTIAEEASDKVVWISSYWGNEGAHRGAIYQYSEGYDVILTFDADEVFEPMDIENALKYVYESPQKYFGVNGYVNFWKSFNWEVRDFFRPIRFINLNSKNTEQGEVYQRIYHFSCAQKEEIMKYKYKIHGHHDELKPDWLNKYYFTWSPTNMVQNLHPTALGIWGDALPFDRTTLPESLKKHINYTKDII
jgi:GT2 family glycosyltransferase